MTDPLTGDILVAYDGTDAARQAARFAADRAAKTGETVDVVHIGNDITTAAIRDAVGDAFADGVPLTVETVSSTGAAHDNVAVVEQLKKLVRRKEYELLVMGNERHGIIHAATQASVTSDLVESRYVPVVLISERIPVGIDPGESDGIMVPYADSSRSMSAAEFAAERAAMTDEHVDVVHVGHDLTTEEMRDAVGDVFADAGVDVDFETVTASGSDRKNVSIKAKLDRHIHENDYRLVFMGNERHGIFYNLVQGSISNALIEDRTIPVVLVP